MKLEFIYNLINVATVADVFILKKLDTQPFSNPTLTLEVRVREPFDPQLTDYA